MAVALQCLTAFIVIRALRVNMREFDRTAQKQIEYIQDLTTAVHNELSFFSHQIGLAASGHVNEAVRSADNEKAVMDHLREIVQNLSDAEAATLETKRLNLQQLGIQSITAVCVSLALAILLSSLATLNVLHANIESLKQEIEQRRRPEQRVEERTTELLRSEERFRSLVEGVKDSAITDGKICTWNPGAERISGSSPHISSVGIKIPPGLEKYAREYIEKHRREFAVMESMLARGSFDELERIARDMKGPGAAFGFPEVTRIGSTIETAAKRKDTQIIGQQLICLAGCLQRASEFVQTEATGTTLSSS